MQKSMAGVQKIRDDLKSKRKRAFADFSRNPSEIRLALEIKLLDERIADLDIALSNSHRQPSGKGGQLSGKPI